MIYGMKDLIDDVLKVIEMHSDKAAAIVYRTAIAESGFTAIKGYTKGNPALSFWQIEPATANDIYENYVKFRPHLVEKLKKLGFKESDPSGPLKYNLSLAIAMCRIKYWRDPSPLPDVDDIDGQAKLWKKVYNTELGKGTLKHFLDANMGKEMK